MSAPTASEMAEEIVRIGAERDLARRESAEAKASRDAAWRRENIAQDRARRWEAKADEVAAERDAAIAARDTWENTTRLMRDERDAAIARAEEAERLFDWKTKAYHAAHDRLSAAIAAKEAAEQSERTAAEGLAAHMAYSAKTRAVAEAARSLVQYIDGYDSDAWAPQERALADAVRGLDAGEAPDPQGGDRMREERDHYREKYLEQQGTIDELKTEIASLRRAARSREEEEFAAGLACNEKEKEQLRSALARAEEERDFFRGACAGEYDDEPMQLVCAKCLNQPHVGICSTRRFEPAEPAAEGKLLCWCGKQTSHPVHAHDGFEKYGDVAHRFSAAPPKSAEPKPEAIDEWNDSLCADALDWAVVRPRDWKSALQAIKGRNARIAQLEADERFNLGRIRKLEEELGTLADISKSTIASLERQLAEPRGKP